MLTAALCLIGFLATLNVVVTVVFLARYEKLMVRALAYSKATTVFEAENALAEPTPPEAPKPAGEELMVEAQKKAYA